MAGESKQLPYMVGDTVAGELIQLGQDFGLPGHQLFVIQSTLSDIRELLVTQNAILAEAFETLEK